jgi:exodeoxyribonuclease VII small subunit
MAEADKEPTFEMELKALESVVAKLETGDVPLEESIRLFEEGMRRSAVCQKLLDEADRKIELLLRKPDGIVRQTEDEGDILGKDER